MLIYLASGTIHHGDARTGFTAYDSEFARDAKDRAERERSLHAWKAKRGGQDQMWSRSLVWAQSGIPENKTMVVGHLGRGPAADEMLYSLRMRGGSGLFRYSFTTREEFRYFHRNDFLEHGFCADAAGSRIAIAIEEEDGSSHVHLLDAGGKDAGPITAGDAFDAFPCFTADGRAILYQSMGIGRNAQGLVAAHGPAVIHRLDLERGDGATVLDDARFDFLKPTPCADGSLLCIRRPYRPVGHYPVAALLKDVVLFPFHLGSAVLGFLNVFSIMFGNRPLTSAGAPTIPVPESRVFLYGRLIDAKKALEASARSAAGPSLVPSQWTLMRYPQGVGQNGGEELARHVAGYALAPGGEILVTNGCAIRALGGAGAPALATGALIEDILVL